MVAITVCVTVFLTAQKLIERTKKGQKKSPLAVKMQFINTFHTSLPALVMSHFNGVTQHGKCSCYINIKISISKGTKRKRKNSLAEIPAAVCGRGGMFFFKTASLSKSN